MIIIIRAIDRFCERFPRFGIPQLARILVFATGLVYLLSRITDDGALISWLFFLPHEILGGQVWRLLTFIFVPTQSNPIWFAVSLVITYMLGTALERLWGTAKFNLFILLNILILAGAGMIVHFFAPTLSWAIGLFVSGYFIQTFLIFAYITFASGSTFNLYFVLPVRAGLVALIIGGGLLYELFFGQVYPHLFPLNFLPFVLLIPYFIFCGGALLGRQARPAPSTNKAVINFRRAAKKIEREQQARAYTRKCAVCGKTDTDYPDMEFRYCSRCKGYHCFCMEHINNHVHFK